MDNYIYLILQSLHTYNLRYNFYLKKYFQNLLFGALISPTDPVAANLCSQLDLQKAVEKADRKLIREKKKIEKEKKLATPV